MKEFIFAICFMAVFVLASSQAHAVKDHKKKSADNTVETRDEVIITVSEPIIKTEDISLGQAKARLAREIEIMNSYIASVAVMEAELPLYQAEADKVILKAPLIE